MKTLNVKTLSISQKLGIGFTSGFVIVDNSNNPIKDEMGVLVFRTKSAAIAFITPVVISGMSYRKVRNPHSSNYPVSLQLV